MPADAVVHRLLISARRVVLIVLFCVAWWEEQRQRRHTTAIVTIQRPRCAEAFATAGQLPQLYSLKDSAAPLRSLDTCSSHAPVVPASATYTFAARRGGAACVRKESLSRLRER